MGDVHSDGLQRNRRRWTRYVCVRFVKLSCQSCQLLSHSPSLGFSDGDGTLHLGFDQHDNPLRYRVSQPGIASLPSNTAWGPEIFGPTLVRLLILSYSSVLRLSAHRITSQAWSTWTSRCTSSMSPIRVFCLFRNRRISKVLVLTYYSSFVWGDLV